MSHAVAAFLAAAHEHRHQHIMSDFEALHAVFLLYSDEAALYESIEYTFRIGHSSVGKLCFRVLTHEGVAKAALSNHGRVFQQRANDLAMLQREGCEAAVIEALQDDAAAGFEVVVR